MSLQSDDDDNNNNNNIEDDISDEASSAINSSQNSNQLFGVPVVPFHVLQDSQIIQPDYEHPLKHYIIELNDKKYITFNNNSVFDNQEQKYAYLDHAEKAYDLVHQALYKVCYFSELKPQVLYEAPKLFSLPHSSEKQPDILTSERMENLNDIARQNLLLGITTAIYYLYQKGYAIPNFSLDYVFLENNYPKITGYVNFQNLEYDPDINSFRDKVNEIDIVKRLILATYKYLLSKTDLIELHLGTNAYKVIQTSCNSTFLDQKLNQDQSNQIHSLLIGKDADIPAFLWPQIGIFIKTELYPMLNRVSENFIKNLVQYRPNTCPFLFEMLCYERHDLVLQEFPKDGDNILKITRNPFRITSPQDEYDIYCKIIEKTFTEDLRNHRRPYLPIAIIHLKKAAKQGHKKSIIVLANQYIKGKMVPANYHKAIKLLSSPLLQNDKEISKIIDQIRSKLNDIENSIPGEQKDFYLEAKEGKNPLLKIFIAFSFYSGLNGFPKSMSHAVTFYREASKLSPYYMCLLGTFYYRGIIFPRNLKRAQNCFKRSSIGGCIKAKILDNLFRKHLWRKYMNKVDLELIMQKYLQCPTSLSFDDSMIFPTAVYIAENTRFPLLFDSPVVNYFYYYDDRNHYKDLNRSEIKFDLRNARYPIKTEFDQEYKELFKFPFKVIDHLQKADIQVHDVNNFLYAHKNIRQKEKHQLDADRILKNHFLLNDCTYHFYCRFILKNIKDKHIVINSISYYPDISIPKSDPELKEIKKILYVLTNFEVKKKLADRIFKSKSDKEYVIENEIRDLMAAIEDEKIDKILENVDVTQFSLEDLNEKYFNKFSFRSKHKDVPETWDTPNHYTPKVCLSPEISSLNSSTDSLTLLKIADSYFDGLNGYPVNYKEAAHFYKSSADKGNSKAQWKYAQMCANGLGVRQSLEDAFNYFSKSAEQEDDEGMLRFALFIRHLLIDSIKDIDFKLPSFQQLIEKSAKKGNIEAIHHLGICYESTYSISNEIKKAFETYRQAIDLGHIESLRRFSQLFTAIDNQDQFDEYSKYLFYSAGLFDVESMLNLIEYLNKRKEYNQARNIIDAGMTINTDAFTPYLAENISVFSLKPDYEKANRLLDPYLNEYLKRRDSYEQSENKDESERRKFWAYYEKYVMVKLKILLALNSKDTINALFQFKNCLSIKSKDDFIEFYKKLDKVATKKYNVSLSFYLPECREVAGPVMMIKSKETESNGIAQLKFIYEKDPNNPFALLNYGKLFIKGVRFHVRSDPVKAIDLIQKAAQKNIPEALFEIGKIYFYGHICPSDTKKAFNYFWEAFDELNRDPRAGYYLANERFITYDDDHQNEFTKHKTIIKPADADKYLNIAAEFGYMRALYKIGIRDINSDDQEVARKARENIIYASKQGYEKATNFIEKNGELFSNINGDQTELSDISLSDEN